MNEVEAIIMPVTWEYIPDLKAPFLVAGFHGWSNAGGVSSDTVTYLIDSLRPKVFARLTEEPFINLSLERPVGHIEDGVIHELESMSADLLHWNNRDGEHDLILLLGREPHYNWTGYTRILLDAMVKLDVKRLYTLGGVQDTISHNVPPIVSVVGSSPYVVAGTARLDEGIRAADYYGQVSIHSFIVRACTELGMEGVSLWGHVPAYLQKSPRVVAKLVTILNNALGMQCPVQELTRQSAEMDRKIQDALLRDPNLKRFVETVEQRNNQVDSEGYADKVIRLNDFLHRAPQDDSDR